MTLTELIAKLEAIKADHGGSILCVHRSGNTLEMLEGPAPIKHTERGEEKVLMVALERAGVPACTS